jgi:hypothetical protein
MAYCIVAMVIVLCADAALATQPDVDNFDGRYLGSRSYWDQSIVYTRDLTNSSAFMGTYSMQVTYNKALGGTWHLFGYDAGGTGYDFSSYDTFSFMLYSVLNNTQIQINILDNDNDEMRYGAVTVNQGAGWQRVSWDLSAGTFVPNGSGTFNWDHVRRILYYVWGGNGVASGIFRMDEIQFSDSSLSTPTVDSPLTDVNQDGTYPVTWNSIGGASLYEIWTEDSSMFVDANANAGSGWTSSRPTVNSADVTVSSSGTYYNKVRACSAAPESGGACSLWSDSESLDVVIDPLYNISVTLDGTGTGTVVSTPSGITCPGTCSAYFGQGSITLTATPGAGSVMDGWSGIDNSGNSATCTVTVADQDIDVGATFNLDGDGDGISDVVENAGPNNGDGNENGTADSLESNVATFQSTTGSYVTLVSETGTSLTNVAASDNPSSGDAPGDYTFTRGFFGFTVNGLTPGAATTVTLILHAKDTSLSTYYKYGPTSDNHADHWYSFLSYGTTGAEITHGTEQTTVLLSFIDGQRGDDDLSANGEITDVGAPANRTGDGGGNCFISAVGRGR